MVLKNISCVDIMSPVIIWIVVIVILVIAIIIATVFLLRKKSSPTPETPHKIYNAFPVITDVTADSPIRYSLYVSGNSVICDYLTVNPIPFFPLARLTDVLSPEYCFLTQPTQYSTDRPSLLFPQKPTLLTPLTWGGNVGWYITLTYANTSDNTDRFYIEITNGSTIYSLKIDPNLHVFLPMVQDRTTPSIYYSVAKMANPTNLVTEWYTQTEITE